MMCLLIGKLKNLSLMQSRILEVIKAGCQAPSGENCQPWSFCVNKDNSVDVFNLTERDDSPYSWGQRASYVAHGALLENMKIAGTKMGLTVHWQLFPDSKNLKHIAHVLFSEDKNIQVNPLSNFIDERCTNRKSYQPVVFSAEDINKLTSTVGEQSSKVKVHLTSQAAHLPVLAEIGGANERVMLENKDLHSFFFNHISWTPEQDAQKSIGFYIKTLELRSEQLKAFKIFRNWKLLKILNLFGASRFVAKENSKLYGTASAFAAITIPDKNEESFVDAGMVLERLWLTASAMGLSVQPMTGLLFLNLGIEAGDGQVISKKHKKLISANYERLKKVFGVNNSHVVMMLRIGKSDKPSARSSRLSPNVEYRE